MSELDRDKAISILQEMSQVLVKHELSNADVFQLAANLMTNVAHQDSVSPGNFETCMNCLSRDYAINVKRFEKGRK
jgi:uncharacterized protein YejL (UPF0352 family)